MQTPDLQAQVIYAGSVPNSQYMPSYIGFQQDTVPTYQSVGMQKVNQAVNNGVNVYSSGNGYSNGLNGLSAAPPPLQPPPQNFSPVQNEVTGSLQPMSFQRTKSDEDQEVKRYNLEQNINTMNDVEKQVEKLAMKKANTPPHKLFFLGFLAGWWIGIAAIFSITLAGGIPIDVRNEWPMLPKLVAGLFFPVAICFIVLFGGELFTGNSMYMLIGFWAKRVTFGGLLYNWSMVLFSNFCGCVLTVYLFGYLSQSFEKEPWLSYVQDVAEKKVKMDASVTFVRAIPANALVCTCILFGLSARDMWGKMVSMWFPVTVFAVAGYEHAIANMTYVPLGLMYGADAKFLDWLGQNLLVAIAGDPKP